MVIKPRARLALVVASCVGRGQRTYANFGPKVNPLLCPWREADWADLPFR
jgi:hypothetical protein